MKLRAYHTLQYVCLLHFLTTAAAEILDFDPVFSPMSFQTCTVMAYTVSFYIADFFYHKDNNSVSKQQYLHCIFSFYFPATVTVLNILAYMFGFEVMQEAHYCDLCTVCIEHPLQTITLFPSTTATSFCSIVGSSPTFS